MRSDTLTPDQRRRAMQACKSKDTSIELRLRRALHHRGLRFRIHFKGMPGTPDVVFTRAKIAVFIDGDFWHGYRYRSWCHKLSPYWQQRLEKNRSRDCRNFLTLRRMGWRVLRIWEHEIKKDLDGTVERVRKNWNARVLR